MSCLLIPIIIQLIERGVSSLNANPKSQYVDWNIGYGNSDSVV